MSDIIVKFKPSGHKQLIDAIKKLELAQKGASGANREYQKSGNGALKTSRLLGGSFATFRSHLLLYNFAMGLGIKQTIQFAKQAAKVQDMSRAFTTLSKTGENSAIAVSKLSNSVKNTMSRMDLFQQANNAMILGVTRNTDEMAEMFKIAQTLGAALGVDTARAVESLITGIGRQSRLMLDNIGIIVKADEAYAEYAKSINKSASDLTAAEKKQAFFTAAMESARSKAAELGSQQLTARDKFNQFNTTMEDFTDFIGEKTTPIVLTFFNSFGETLKRLTETDLETSIRKLQELGFEAESLASLNRVLSLQEAAKQLKKSETEIDNSLNNLLKFYGGSEDTIKSFGIEVEKVMSPGRYATSKPFFDFQFNLDDLNIDALRDEMKRLVQETDESADALSKTGDVMFFDPDKLNQTIDNNTKLLAVYTQIEASFMKMEEAKKTLSSTDEGVFAQNENMVLINEEIVKSEEKKISVRQRLIKIGKQALQFTKDLTKVELSSYAQLAGGMGQLLGTNKKNALVAARLDQSSAIISALASANDIMKEGTGGFASRVVQATAALAYGFANAAKIENELNKMGGSSGGGSSGGGISGADGPIGTFAEGGYVGGRPHSEGGTMIEAERGEFVMSKNAVDSIGLETLNQMNQSGGGSVNVNVTGNVLTQDFVEGELAESIKEAVRRGSDFGLS